MYLVRNVLHSHNTLTQHIRENLPSVTRPFLSSCMDLGTRLGIYCVCLSSILGIRLHAHTDGHLCCTARILGTCTHNHTHLYWTHCYHTVSILGMTHKPAHLYCTARTPQPLIAQRGSREWGYTHTHTRDGLVPIPNIWCCRYWLTQWWYRYVQALSTCFDTCVCHTAHALSLRFHALCYICMCMLSTCLSCIDASL